MHQQFYGLIVTVIIYSQTYNKYHSIHSCVTLLSKKELLPYSIKVVYTHLY